MPLVKIFLGIIPIHGSVKYFGGSFQNVNKSKSLVVQLLRIHLPVQRTQVQSLVQEDPTCCGATKPMRHNY